MRRGPRLVYLSSTWNTPCVLGVLSMAPQQARQPCHQWAWLAGTPLQVWQKRGKPPDPAFTASQQHLAPTQECMPICACCTVSCQERAEMHRLVQEQVPDGLPAHQRQQRAGNALRVPRGRGNARATLCRRPQGAATAAAGLHPILQAVAGRSPGRGPAACTDCTARRMSARWWATGSTDGQFEPAHTSVGGQTHSLRDRSSACIDCNARHISAVRPPAAHRGSLSPHAVFGHRNAGQ